TAQDPGVHRQRPVAALYRVSGDGRTLAEERRAQISRGHRRRPRLGTRSVYRPAGGPQFRQARGQARRRPDTEVAMRRLSILAMVLAMVLAGAACQPLSEATVTGATAAAENPGAQPAAAEPPCTSYTVPITVGGQQQQASVEACQQPDGSWRVTQNTPGLPPQVYDVPA